jgi:hypothetical protein
MDKSDMARKKAATTSCNNNNNKTYDELIKYLYCRLCSRTMQDSSDVRMFLLLIFHFDSLMARMFNKTINLYLISFADLFARKKPISFSHKNATAVVNETESYIARVRERYFT